MRFPTRTLPKVPEWLSSWGQPPPWGSDSRPVLGTVGSTLAGLQLFGLMLSKYSPASSPTSSWLGMIFWMMSPGLKWKWS